MQYPGDRVAFRFTYTAGNELRNVVHWTEPLMVYPGLYPVLESQPPLPNKTVYQTPLAVAKVEHEKET